MSLDRRIEGSEPVGGEPVARLGGAYELRRDERAGRLATGTLACPMCDAPVALGAAVLSPADALGCPYCEHAGTVRDFLSLAGPPRPARVDVRVVDRRR